MYLEVRGEVGAPAAGALLDIEPQGTELDVVVAQVRHEVVHGRAGRVVAVAVRAEERVLSPRAAFEVDCWELIGEGVCHTSDPSVRPHSYHIDVLESSSPGVVDARRDYHQRM